MSLIRYNPNIKHIDRNEFLAPFDKFFDEMFTNQFPDLSKEFGVGFFEKQSYPRVDVIDHNESVEIIAEIPGLTKDEVSVEVQDNILTISGQKIKSYEEKDNKKYIRKELKHSSFKRSFTLGDNIDSDNPEAKFENGLLQIVLQKVKPTIPTAKKVKIK